MPIDLSTSVQDKSTLDKSNSEADQTSDLELEIPLDLTISVENKSKSDNIGNKRSKRQAKPPSLYGEWDYGTNVIILP